MVKNTIIGFTNAFKKARMIATKTAVQKLRMLTPGSSHAASITATAETRSLMMMSMILIVSLGKNNKK